MTSDPSSTLLLLKRWHAGDREALGVLLERNIDWIRAHVRRRLGQALRQKAETQDFVQEAMADVLRYGPKFTVADEGRFRALLARIVENVLRDQHDHFAAQKRAAAKERPLPSDTVLELDPPNREVTRPSQVASRREESAWLALGLEMLDAGDRAVILLRQQEGLPFAEVGRRLGVSEEAARFRFQRALPRLAKRIEDLRRGRLDEALGAAET